MTILDMMAAVVALVLFLWVIGVLLVVWGSKNEG